MPKTATKAAGNVFYEARMAAGTWNDKFYSREGAAEITGLDRTRLAHIELDTIYPHPEEVLILSEYYNAPELRNHYCASICPVGKGAVSRVELAELEGTALQLLKAFNELHLPTITVDLISICADGKIDKTEQPRITEILSSLDETSKRVEALKLLVKKRCGEHGTI